MSDPLKQTPACELDRDNLTAQFNERPLEEQMRVAYATEIERLQAEIERLRAALKPFAGLIVPSNTDPDEIQHFALPARMFFDAVQALKDRQ